MTPEQFRKARQSLGLSISQMAEILGINPRTVRRWEEGDALPPNPTASRVMQWMLDGFRPPEWPDKLKAGAGGNPTWVKKNS